MNSYLLLNKDVKLLAFTIEETALGEVVKQTASFSDVRPVGFSDINTWLVNRNYAKHKQHFEQWIKEWGIDKLKGFVEITHALGINDCLWVKPESSNLKWEDINLYQNEFTDVAQNTAFESGLYGLKLSSTDLRSPEFTSEGTAPKCWVKENDGIYLYKGALSGAANVGLEPYAEYLSADIARQIVHNDSISYDLAMFKNKLCSKCRLFTTEEYGYVPFYRFIDANRQYNLNDILHLCADMGFENECKEMLLIDSITFNQDRHLGNFGFYVDNESFEIVKFAPLFDYNSSMLCNAMPEDIESVEAFKRYENEYRIEHRLGGKFSEVGRAILNDALLSMIPKELHLPQHPLYNLSSDRTEKLLDILEYNLHQITGKRYYEVKQIIPDSLESKKRKNERD